MSDKNGSIATWNKVKKTFTYSAESDSDKGYWGEM